MAAKKRKTKRERFAGYPYADAYAIQYEQQTDAQGKKLWEVDSDGDYKRTRKGEKIPVLTAKEIKKDGQAAKKKVKQLPWGFVVKESGETRTWRERGKNVTYTGCHLRNDSGGFRTSETVWIREDKLEDQRLLEVVFVDIGQGDGCFLVTPDNKRMVIDAGQRDNMRHYLNWRHGAEKEATFECAVISHPDADHYQGFEKLFERQNFFFETIYTNGLMERAVSGKEERKTGRPVMTSLGPVQTIDGVKYVTDLVTSKDELADFLEKKENWASRHTRGKNKGKIKTTKRLVGEDDRTPEEELEEEQKVVGKQFPEMLNEALAGWKKVKKRAGYTVEFLERERKRKKSGTMGDYQMLSIDAADTEPKYMPGYGPDGDLTIQVLGPVTKTHGGKKMLQWFDSGYTSTSKTKNGHSVVLRLQYKNVSMMLGGDLNIPSEDLLLEHHTGMASPPDRQHEAAFIEAARRVFQVDIAKSCHHGSSDFTEFFLRALNPIATVISSGDNESHSHPRSDTLGTIGRHSRSSPRPLIFSTELARSTKDNKQKPFEIRDQLLDEMREIIALDAPEKRERAIKKFKEELKKEMPRSVAVYGAIHVVTDGEKAIIYQKLETKGSHGSYDIYRLEPSGKDRTGPLVYQSKH